MKTIKSNITLRAAVNRVKWMRKSEYFTTRFLWKALIEVENNPMESYWDYRDEFSSEQLKKIEENGREGYYDVYNEIEENNWEKIVEKNDDSALWAYATKEGRGKVLWPLRVALSGEMKSPDPFEIMKVIKKEAVLRRIDNAILQLQTNLL